MLDVTVSIASIAQSVSKCHRGETLRKQLGLIVSASLFETALPTEVRFVPTIDTGDTAWVLASTALVLFMTPGLAFFYAGMVRAKHVLAMLMQNFFAMGIVTVLWVLFGYSLAFGGAGNGGIIGNLDFIGLKDMTGAVSGTIP
jgi:hypothetical protein